MNQARWRMLAIGPGPGPKNVLAEDSEGNRTVVPYMVWKHKLSQETNMAAGDVYGPIQGFVAFDVEGKTLPSGVDIRSFKVNSFETGELIGCTLWPEFAELDVQKGDLVIGEGKITTNDSGGKTYTNISLNRVVVIPGFEPAEAEVAKPASTRRRRSSS